MFHLFTGRRDGRSAHRVGGNSHHIEANIIRTFVRTVLAALFMTLALSACQSVTQESAMEWMQRQPSRIDP
jgi:hypothetical protein